MKKFSLRVISLLLVFTLLLSSAVIIASAEEPTKVETVENIEDSKLYSYLTSENIDPSECSNSVVIPGLFQSRTRLYDENGNDTGKEPPFFLGETGDIVKLALKKALLPLLLTLVTQRDWGGMLSKKVSEVLGEVIAKYTLTDDDGNFVYDVRADKYEGSVAELRAQGREEDIEYIYDQIPLRDYAAICGEEHLYFYSYASFGNLDKITDELYALILKAAKASPTGKANIVPISQGGTLANNLLSRYPEVGQYLDRIVYIIPALDGSVLLGEIFDKGLIDDNDALYKEMFPILINDDDLPFLGYLINTILRILPNSVVNSIIDDAVDELIGGYLERSTAMWALVPSANYTGAIAKYLQDPEDAKLRAQTDYYYKNAQVKSDDNIMYQIETYGVKVFDIVDYNSALYPICDSWNKVNADGIIQVDSTSMGATTVAVDVELPADYKPAKDAKYIDPYNLLDAGSGLLPDQTFYFHNQNHERTGNCDVIMKLATCLLSDNSFTSVNSYPDKFPQFNEGRVTKNYDKYLENCKNKDLSNASEADKAEFEAALAEAVAQYESTKVDSEKFEASRERLYAINDKIDGKATEPTVKDKVGDFFSKGFTDIAKAISDFFYDKFEGASFGVIILDTLKSILGSIKK